MFINSNTMVIVTKWSELNDFSFKLDKTFSEQLMKFDEQVLLLKELGGTISEQDNTFILTKTLSLSYKEKLSNILSMQSGQKTYPEVRQLFLQIFERDMAWKTLPSDTGKDIPSTESGLFEMERGKERGEKERDKEDKWGEKGGKGGKSERWIWKRGPQQLQFPPARLCLLQLQQEGLLHNILPSFTHCRDQREALEVQGREEEQRKGKERRKERGQGKRTKERKGSKLPSFRCLP
jgi:hypothetical protein